MAPNALIHCNHPRGPRHARAAFATLLIMHLGNVFSDVSEEIFDFGGHREIFVICRIVGAFQLHTIVGSVGVVVVVIVVARIASFFVVVLLIVGLVHCPR